MKLSIRAKTVPGRAVTGAYILRNGLIKWKGGDEQAARTHDMVTGAFPILRPVPARYFQRLLATAEIATGTALLTPFVPATLAGAALTGLSGGMLTMLVLPRTEAAARGLGVNKDVWMVGIGLGLMAEGAAGKLG